MSITSRPTLLFVLGLSALTGCGSDTPTDGTDGGDAPDARLVDARPRTMVMLGSRGQCPRELQVDGDQLYWLEDDVLVRSGTTELSPEVMYTGVNGTGLRVAGASAYWVGTWPVRLDLETRLARPLVTTPVQGIEIVDGARLIVLAESTRIAEIDGAGALRDLHAADIGRSLDMLSRSGRWLLWRTGTFESPVLQWRDAVGGQLYSAAGAQWRTSSTSAHAAVFYRLDGASRKLRVIEDGADRGETELPSDVSRVAVTDGGELYAIQDPGNLLVHAPALRGTIGFSPVSTATRFDEVVALGEGAIAVTCTPGNGATFYRWYP